MVWPCRVRNACWAPPILRNHSANTWPGNAFLSPEIRLGKKSETYLVLTFPLGEKLFHGALLRSLFVALFPPIREEGKDIQDPLPT